MSPKDPAKTTQLVEAMDKMIHEKPVLPGQAPEVAMILACPTQMVIFDREAFEIFIATVRRKMGWVEGAAEVSSGTARVARNGGALAVYRWPLGSPTTCDDCGGRGCYDDGTAPTDRYCGCAAGWVRKIAERYCRDWDEACELVTGMDRKTLGEKLRRSGSC